MRRTFVILLVALLGSVFAAAAGAKQEALSRAYGDVTWTSTPSVVGQDTFDVRGDPVTLAATGFYERRIGTGFLIRAEINCLNVNGNEATMSGPITAAFPPPQDPTVPPIVGSTFRTRVVDGNSLGGPDMIGFIETAGLPCSSGVATQLFQPIISGDVVVQECAKFKETKKKEKCKVAKR
jgi:hypothetical protein